MPETKLKKKPQVLSEVLKKLESTIQSIQNIKRKAHVLNWLSDFCRYLYFEPKFDPKRLRKYEPGDIIDVDFGFNVGAELGGRHYAVVIEVNARSDGTVMVVPLSSYKSSKEVHSSEVDLGVIPELNQNRGNSHPLGTKARISHQRSISKMRIYYPKNKNEFLCRLSDVQLQKIYDAIQYRFAGKKE